MRRKVTAGALALLALLALWPTLVVGEEGEPTQAYSLLSSAVGVALPWASGRDGDDQAFLVALIVAALILVIVGWIPLPRSSREPANGPADPRKPN